MLGLFSFLFSGSMLEIEDKQYQTSKKTNKKAPVDKTQFYLKCEKESALPFTTNYCPEILI